MGLKLASPAAAALLGAGPHSDGDRHRVGPCDGQGRAGGGGEGGGGEGEGQRGQQRKRRGWGRRRRRSGGRGGRRGRSCQGEGYWWGYWWKYRAQGGRGGRGGSGGGGEEVRGGGGTAARGAGTGGGGGGGRDGGAGLPSSPFRLNVNAFCGIGGTFGSCRGRLGGVRGHQGVLHVYSVSETAQVELKSGRM